MTHSHHRHYTHSLSHFISIIPQRKSTEKVKKMAEYDERYEGNGEEEDLHNSHPHPHLDSSPQPTHDDLIDSKSHVCFLSLSAPPLSLFLSN